METANPCLFCEYVRERSDICGIYCVGEFHKDGNKCEHFTPYETEEAAEDEA